MLRTVENIVEKRVASRDFDNEMATFSPTSPGVVYWLKHPRVQSLEEALGIFCGAFFCGGEQDGGRWRQVLQDTWASTCQETFSSGLQRKHQEGLSPLPPWCVKAELLFQFLLP